MTFIIWNAFIPGIFIFSWSVYIYIKCHHYFVHILCKIIISAKSSRRLEKKMVEVIHEEEEEDMEAA